MPHEGLYQFHGDKFDVRIRVYSCGETRAVVTERPTIHTYLGEANDLLVRLNEDLEGVPVELQSFIIDSVCENTL